MSIRFRPIPALALVLATAFAGEVRADPPAPAAAGQAPDRKRAAASFDEGVTRYAKAEFAEAARAFLEADRLSPSAVAISNAISAAKRAGDHLLVARTAERAIARGDAVVEAREALADAATRLARLELGCEATPCAITLDGEAAGGAVYVLPGTHRVEARGGAGASAEQRVVVIAGATYRVALRPEVHEAGAPPPGVVPVPARRGLPPGVFVAGAVVTAALAGLVVWSGTDALSAKRALPAAPDAAEEDDVLARARRTDYLLLGAGLAGVGSAVIGAAFTDWRGPPAVGVAPVPGGAALTVGGRF